LPATRWSGYGREVTGLAGAYLVGYRSEMLAASIAMTCIRSRFQLRQVDPDSSNAPAFQFSIQHLLFLVCFAFPNGARSAGLGVTNWHASFSVGEPFAAQGVLVDGPLRLQKKGCLSMEGIVFVGLQGSGKSSFFKERFFSTYVRISLDLLKTRHREQRFLDACLATEQRFVIDNTNPTQEERARYIEAAKAARYTVVGYYFQSRVEDCLRRNSERPETERVPDVAILSSAKKLKLPTWEEGFDQLYYVRLEDRRFIVEEWRDEV